MGNSQANTVELRRHRLKYVFSMFFVQKIIWADEVAEPEELAYVQEHFPSAVLQALDLTDPETFPPLLEEALTTLPTELSEDERKELLSKLPKKSRFTGLSYGRLRRQIKKMTGR